MGRRKRVTIEDDIDLSDYSTQAARKNPTEMSARKAHSLRIGNENGGDSTEGMMPPTASLQKRRNRRLEDWALSEKAW